ncbi:hypothetical protein KC19_5G086500 [Ceratodon purpureus]|uniref:Protein DETOXIFICATION n=1 Tax=Ceratodon purpureus TaxID=3225 RepID=A0A8T0HZA2_CERPU|nr:hypothetical protein KC19_5G086500 [Ceratodon purpureus]
MENLIDDELKLHIQSARSPRSSNADMRSGLLPTTAPPSERSLAKSHYSTSSDACQLMADGDVDHALQRWPTMRQIWAELKKQRPIGVPVAIMNVLWFARFIISTMFLGRLGSMELAGGTMALTFANVTGFSILMGLAGGMEPICGQAYGARRYKLMGITLQRCILVLLLTSIPISCVWWNVEKVLLSIGQEPAIARMAKQYLRYLLPDLYATAIVTPLRIFLRSQCITKPMMVCSGVALVLHVPINYMIVYWFRSGAPGTALANFFADANLILFLYVYLKRTGMCQSSWPGWSKACLVEWMPLLRLSIPSCLMTCLEWWCYEFLMMLAGLLQNAHECVASMAIVINGDSILYALQLALSSCVCTRVGNELGANRPLRAYHASIAALGLSAGLGCFGAICLISERFVWGRLFTDDPQILRGVAQILPIMGLCELGNFPQTVACGILRGSARPSIGACINLGSFYLIGLPLSLLLAFVFKLGLLGLWLGLLAAVTTCAALTVTSIIRTDWVKQAIRAHHFAVEQADATEVSSSVDHETNGAAPAPSKDSFPDAASPRICIASNNSNWQLEEVGAVSTEKEVLLLKRIHHNMADDHRSTSEIESSIPRLTT